MINKCEGCGVGNEGVASYFFSGMGRDVLLCPKCAADAAKKTLRKINEGLLWLIEWLSLAERLASLDICRRESEDDRLDAYKIEREGREGKI